MDKAGALLLYSPILIIGVGYILESLFGDQVIEDFFNKYLPFL